MVREAFDEVCSWVTLMHIGVYSKYLLNDRADRLAKCGTAGLRRGDWCFFPYREAPDD